MIQVLPLQGQQPDLLLQCQLPVKIRALQDPSDLLQRELQFPEQQNLLQMLQRPFVIQPIAGFGVCGGGQQSDPVVILQGTDADTGALTNLVNRHHKTTSIASINYNAASESSPFSNFSICFVPYRPMPHPESLLPAASPCGTSYRTRTDRSPGT